jgi:hypothetical protein
MALNQVPTQPVTNPKGTLEIHALPRSIRPEPGPIE